MVPWSLHWRRGRDNHDSSTTFLRKIMLMGQDQDGRNGLPDWKCYWQSFTSPIRRENELRCFTMQVKKSSTSTRHSMQNNKATITLTVTKPLWNPCQSTSSHRRTETTKHSSFAKCYRNLTKPWMPSLPVSECSPPIVIFLMLTESWRARYYKGVVPIASGDSTIFVRTWHWQTCCNQHDHKNSQNSKPKKWNRWGPQC